KRIVYRAASGESVTIVGSERITSWTQSGSTWKAVVPNSMLDAKNPFSTTISGDYLTFGGDHHLGMVFFNGAALNEKLNDSDVMANQNTWHATVDGTNTTITANFGSGNPNDGMAEVTARKYVFAPTVVGTSFITVQGFHIMQAATNWAPPT